MGLELGGKGGVEEEEEEVEEEEKIPYMLAVLLLLNFYSMSQCKRARNLTSQNGLYNIFCFYLFKDFLLR